MESNKKTKVTNTEIIKKAKHDNLNFDNMEQHQKPALLEYSLKEERKNQFRKSNYWFALPSKKHTDKVDITELYPTDNQFSNRWVKLILDTDSPSAQIQPIGHQAKVLKSMYHERKGNSQQKIGFGYPMLVMDDTTGQRPFVNAPLFVWNVNLERSKDIWKIYRSADLPITPNELVIQYLEKKGISIRKNFEEAISNNQISSLHLQKLCNDISIKLNFETSVNTLSLKESPTYDEALSISKGNGQIVWSGILGLFEMLPTEYLKNEISTPENLENKNNTETIEPIKSYNDDYRKHGFSSTLMNPYQSRILRELAEHDRISVCGNSYTGMNQFIIGLASNILVNGGKTLIISNHPELLDATQKRINRHLGMDNLAFSLHDFEGQKEILFAFLRQLGESTKKHLPFDEEEFQLTLNIANRLQGKLDSMHNALNQVIFKDKTWIELIGDFLKNHGEEGRQLLNSQLLSTDYTYNSQSYETLKNIVLKGKQLYQDVNTLRHPLEVLHFDIFTQDDKKTAENFTRNQIETHDKSISELYHNFVMHIEEYGQALQSIYESYHTDLSTEAIDIQENIADNKQRFGEDFNKWNFIKNTKLKLFSAFSERSRTNLQSKKELLKRFEDLKTRYYNKRYFDYSFSEISSSLTFDKISENLEDFKISLRNWKQDFPVIIHNEIQRLSVQTIHPDLDYKSQLTELNAQLSAVVTNLNDTKLFKNDYEISEGFVINNKMSLERIMDQLESLNFNLRDFSAYYDWKVFWLELSEPNRIMLKAFITTKPNNWEKAFDSWFLHQILSQYQNESIPNNDMIFNQYFENHEKLQAFIPRKIENYWTHRRSAVLRDLRREDKMGFNTYFGKRVPSGLFDIPMERMMQSYKETILDIIPVLCTTPDIAANYLAKNSYEAVIILEADDITVSEGYPLLLMGKQTIVSGSGKLKKKDKSETLMEYTTDNYQNYLLPYETVDKQFYSDFINRAFHRGKLIRSISTKPINFELSLRTVEGHVDENNLYNEIEANEIIKILQGLKSSNAKYLPKVGIVCFNKAQRNHLIEQLSRIKEAEIEGHAIISHFERNGLKVCALEDIVGKSFDITIASTTFSSNSTIDVDFSFLKNEDGEYWLYHLMTSVKEKLIICTSLKNDFIDENRFNYTNNGLNLLCNLMAFANSIQENDTDKGASILAGLHSNYESTYYRENDLVHEIRKTMDNKYQENRIQDSIYFNLAKADFWIKSAHEDGPPVAAVIDSFFWRFPKGDYVWDKLLRDIITAQGFQYHSVWSIDWWKYPKKTPQQLMDFVKVSDAKYTSKVKKNIEITAEIPAETDISETENIITESNEPLEDITSNDEIIIKDVIYDVEIDIIEEKIEDEINESVFNALPEDIEEGFNLVPKKDKSSEDLKSTKPSNE